MERRIRATGVAELAGLSPPQSRLGIQVNKSRLADVRCDCRLSRVR